MKKFLLVLLLSLPCFAQNMRFDAVVWGPKGPVPGATVAVCTQPTTTTTTPCSPLASLCSSLSDNVCSQPNPVTADSLGNYHFYAKTTSGPYTVQIYGPQVAVPYVLTDQYLNGTITGANLVSPIITGANLVTANSGNTVLLLCPAQKPTNNITGNGSFQTIYSCTVPANMLTTGKMLRVTAGIFHNSGSGAVTYQWSVGASAAFNVTTGSTTALTGRAILYMPMQAGTSQVAGSEFATSTPAWGLNQQAAFTFDPTISNVVALQFSAANTEVVNGVFALFELVQ